MKSFNKHFPFKNNCNLKISMKESARHGAFYFLLSDEVFFLTFCYILDNFEHFENQCLMGNLDESESFLQDLEQPVQFAVLLKIWEHRKIRLMRSILQTFYIFVHSFEYI